MQFDYERRFGCRWILTAECKEEQEEKWEERQSRRQNTSIFYGDIVLHYKLSDIADHLNTAAQIWF